MVPRNGDTRKEGTLKLTQTKSGLFPQARRPDKEKARHKGGPKSLYSVLLIAACRFKLAANLRYALLDVR